MTDLGPEQSQMPPQTIEKPTSVTVFGVLNIAVGCYFLVRMIYSWSKIIARVIKEPRKITESGVIELLIIFLSFCLVIWLITLGIGLLTMKRWARRGSVLYGWIQVAFIVITLVAVVFSSTTDWQNFPRIMRASMNLNNALALVHWIYMILLLIFMQTKKVKQAFAAIGG